MSNWPEKKIHADFCGGDDDYGCACKAAQWNKCYDAFMKVIEANKHTGSCLCNKCTDEFIQDIQPKELSVYMTEKKELEFDEKPTGLVPLDENELDIVINQAICDWHDISVTGKSKWDYVKKAIMRKFGQPQRDIPSVHNIYEEILNHTNTVSLGDLSWELKLAESIHDLISGGKNEGN